MSYNLISPDFFGLDNNRCVNFANNGGAAGGAADDSGH